MARLTTGPFVIPGQMLNGASIDNLVINLKNETDSRKKVTVIVDRCREAFFPDRRSETTIERQTIALNPGRCTIFLVLAGPGTFNQFDTLKVTFAGDIQTNANKGIEAWVTTGLNGGPFEPTNTFRHKELFEP